MLLAFGSVKPIPRKPSAGQHACMRSGQQRLYCFDVVRGLAWYLEVFRAPFPTQKPRWLGQARHVCASHVDLRRRLSRSAGVGREARTSWEAPTHPEDSAVGSGHDRPQHIAGRRAWALWILDTGAPWQAAEIPVAAGCQQPDDAAVDGCADEASAQAIDDSALCTSTFAPLRASLAVQPRPRGCRRGRVRACAGRAK